MNQPGLPHDADTASASPSVSASGAEQPIVRGEGVTQSERYLARLAEATFLDLWSYPNTFNDKRSSPKANGQELCDLLVVCGDDVIIFSDKSIQWPNKDDIELSWSRWYRRAVRHSVDQIRGAERWLRNFPDRVFIDAACTQRLPIDLPPPERRRVHGIAIALGAQEACSSYYEGSDGSLMVLPALKGDDHLNPDVPGRMLFALGDVDPDGPFVHVFDETALDLVMRENDTVSDFVRYLNERERLIRGERIVFAPSEAEILAAYLQNEGPDGGYAFPTPADLGAPSDYKIMIPEGEYTHFTESVAYRHRKELQESSYVWDRLIRVFTENVLAGTTVEIGGERPTASRSEVALRFMARESRAVRSALGASFSDLLRTAESDRHPRYARIVLPNEGFADKETGYVFLVLAHPDRELDGGYEQYRTARVSMLEAYCSVALSDNRHLHRMVGIAVDASRKVTGREGGSEDLIAIEIEDWTPELERDVQERREHFDILNPERIQPMMFGPRSGPQPDAPQLSRQQRRAAERRARKEARRRG
jgi:hypothetical protein